MARLELLNGKSAGAVFELEAEDGAWEVGTSRRAQLRIRDRGISYSHATITCEAGVFQLIDEQSLGGTFVNGEQLDQLSPRTLATGDSLRFGSTEAVFTCDAPSPKRSPSSRLDALRSGTEELEKGDLERELTAARAQLQASLEAAEQVRQELTESEEELSRAIEESDALRRRVEELEATPATADDAADRAELEAELADAISEAQAKEAERVTLAAELDATQRALEELKAAEPPPADAQVSEAREAQAQAEARARELEGQIERLRLNLEEALSRHPEPEEAADLAAGELESARARVDELEGELEELRAENQNLHVELEARNTRIQELAEARQDLVEETRSWNAKTRPDAETRPVDPSLVERLRADLPAVEVDPSAGDSEAEDLRQQVEEINAELLDLQDELERLERENNELKERLAGG